MRLFRKKSAPNGVPRYSPETPLGAMIISELRAGEFELRQQRIEEVREMYGEDDVPDRVMEWVTDPETMLDMDREDLQIFDGLVRRYREHKDAQEEIGPLVRGPGPDYRVEEESYG